MPGRHIDDHQMWNAVRFLRERNELVESSLTSRSTDEQPHHFRTNG